MPIEFITYEEYSVISDKLYEHDKSLGRKSNWANRDKRWRYHKKAIRIIARSEVSEPARILEMGTAGVQLVKGSHTLDYGKNWTYPGEAPTFLHDAREVPWPIDDASYDWFIAMRVFHHLAPVQFECFREATRIARNVIIVTPHPTGEEPNKGIALTKFFKWNDEVPPRLVERVDPYGYLYYWDRKSLSK